jgi:PKD repeat protein
MNFRKYSIFFLLLPLVSGGCYKNEPVPTADFIFSANNEFKVPCTVQFSNRSAQAFSYEWWFGSDSSATTINDPGSTIKDPFHLYTKPGVFSVTLRAYAESRKEWASVVKTITIKDTAR